MTKKYLTEEKPLRKKRIAAYLKEDIYPLIIKADSTCRNMIEDFEFTLCDNTNPADSDVNVLTTIDPDGVVDMRDILDRVISLRDIIMSIDLSLTGYIRERLKNK